MKILLLKPPIRASRVEIGRHVPIGLAYLAASLRQEGHDVQLFDALAYTTQNYIVPPAEYSAADRLKLVAHPRWRHLIHWGSSWSTIEQIIGDSQADLVGISCMFTPYYEPAYEAARLARRVLPRARILLGGQHATVAHHHAARERSFDVLIRGEAEVTVTRVAAAIAAGDSLLDIPGIVIPCGVGLCGCNPARQTMHVTCDAPWIDDLDSLPLPATDLIDFSRYESTSTLITSRGCPFSCSFCTVHATVGKRFRARSPRLVVDEIEHYWQVHGIRQFKIEDDNFTFDIDRVRAICREIRQRDLDVELHLTNGMTVVKLTPELAAEMVGAGFRNLFMGLETTDPLQLRKIRKGFTSLEQVRSGAAWFRQYGVDAQASLIVGLLGQSIGQAARDAVNLARAGVPFGVNPFYPIPGSTDYERCLDSGLIHLDTEFGLFEGFNFAIGSDRMTPAEMYWTWLNSQAIAQWPSYTMVGTASQPEHQVGPAAPFGGDPGDALDRLIAESSPLLGPDPKFEVLAVPASTSGWQVQVHPDGCFCSLQNVRERYQGGGPADFCQVTGDVIAAAAGLHLGRELAARQLSSSVHEPASGCRFELAPDVDPVSTRVHRIYLETLAEVTRAEAVGQAG